ncbi:hypothetical protein XM47_13165 [Catenovulum maritimum]|uniref:Response regulatory domain-containing protein n=2 Tax=Catenovulum maritimum TaxID=1513271 RepID=A0A0J8GTM4_9ALTE|nr:hypothetical protein XM47_13165 [Catenovulum maritimum]
MPRVLLVDDVESMREVAKKMLSELGFRKVDEARNAEIALKMLDKAYIEGQPYKLVITDWEMPGKSGLDLLKDIRINENISEADVFLLTSHGAQKNIVQAINAGVTGYLVKPINFITLQKKFGKYLAHIEKPAMA